MTLSDLDRNGRFFATYLQERQRHHTPKSALANTLDRLKNNKLAYSKPAITPAASPWKDTCRWIENADAIGLRFVGFADDIVNLGHRGWYLEPEPFQNSANVYRGALWQLPAKNKVKRYVYGYANPHNEGAAHINFDVTDDKVRAAYTADSMAKNDAETEREYQEAWYKGTDYLEAKQEVNALRLNLLKLFAELRTIRKGVSVNAPTVCATIRASIVSDISRISKLKKTIRTLYDDWHAEAGFKDGAGAA